MVIKGFMALSDYARLLDPVWLMPDSIIDTLHSDEHVVSMQRPTPW